MADPNIPHFGTTVLITNTLRFLSTKSRVISMSRRRTTFPVLGLLCWPRVYGERETGRGDGTLSEDLSMGTDADGPQPSVRQKPLKKGQEHINDLTQLPPPPPHLIMSPEREIVEKFKEAMETKNINIFAPYMMENANCDIFPSSFVVLPLGGTS